MNLQDILIKSAQEFPHQAALTDELGTITYEDLNNLSNTIAHILIKSGVQTGDRVGIWLNKSRYAVAAMQAVLRLGSSYVPLDPLSPLSRILLILQDCNINTLISGKEKSSILNTQAGIQLNIVAIEDINSWEDQSSNFINIKNDENSLAYILYTSGSTGVPKGVCISHKNALAFINWAVEFIKPNANDHFANHAPFHFDLSIFDLYVSLSVGASVFLIPDNLSYAPANLVEFIKQHNITIWYSVPSALIMMIDSGDLLGLSVISLKQIIFAGEPFPAKYLKTLHKKWPDIRYINFYGPTETNVCSYYEINDIPDIGDNPPPIGKASCGNTLWAVKSNNFIANVNEEAELVVSGPSVMMGYWGQKPLESKPYRTGDLVKLLPNGNFIYIGRKDNMVKIRGHRVDIGDIESILHNHPGIKEVAVYINGEHVYKRIIACVVPQQIPPTLLELKKYCSENLPRYMIIDAIRIVPELPRTRNGKLNRLELEHI